MFGKICPCIAWLFNKSDEGKPGYSYQPREELEEEQFMQKNQPETPSSPKNYSPMNEELSIQQQLSNTLGLEEDNKPQSIITEKLQDPMSRLPQEKQQPLYQQQRQSNSLKDTPLKSKSYDFTNLGQLQLNIPQYGANYQLLKQKSHNVGELLDISQNCTQVSVQTSKLKINKTKLRAWRKISNNCFIIQYELPCTFSLYNQIMNRKITPRDSNKLFKQYKLLETIHQNLTLRYVCLNKIGMLEPREFTYLKYTNNSSTNPSGHWELSISKNSQNEEGVGNIGTKLGKLFSVSYIIEEKIAQKTIVRVRTYTCLDIGVTIQKVWERILNETKSYIEQIWQEAANNDSEDLV